MDKGKIIREYRKKQGLTQEELARKVGTYQTTIGKYERGFLKTIPTKTLAKIIAVLNIPFDEIVSPENFELWELVSKASETTPKEPKCENRIELFSGYSGFGPRVFAGDKYLIIEKAKYSPEQLSLLENIIATMDKQNAQ